MKWIPRLCFFTLSAPGTVTVRSRHDNPMLLRWPTSRKASNGQVPRAIPLRAVPPRRTMSLSDILRPALPERMKSRTAKPEFRASCTLTMLCFNALFHQIKLRPGCNATHPKALESRLLWVAPYTSSHFGSLLDFVRLSRRQRPAAEPENQTLPKHGSCNRRGASRGERLQVAADHGGRICGRCPGHIPRS